MKLKYDKYDARIHKIVNDKIVNKSVKELIDDGKRRAKAARELSAMGIKITAFWKKLLTFGWGDDKVLSRLRESRLKSERKCNAP